MNTVLAISLSMTSQLILFHVFQFSDSIILLCNDNKMKNDIKRTSHKRYVKNTFDTGERRNHTHLCLWEKTNSSKVKAYQLGLLVVVEDT